MDKNSGKKCATAANLQGLYNKEDHPRIRIPEADLDRRVLDIFGKIRIDDEEVRDWFRTVFASQMKDSQNESKAQRAELTRQESLLAALQDRLLGMRFRDEIDQDGYAAKPMLLCDRLASIKLQGDAIDRSRRRLPPWRALAGTRSWTERLWRTLTEILICPYQP